MDNPTRYVINVFIGWHTQYKVPTEYLEQQSTGGLKVDINYLDGHPPSLQKEILFDLLSLKESLNIYTNSPYIVGFLSLAAKAKQVADRLGNYPLKLHRLVPEWAAVDITALSVYAVDECGVVTKVPYMETGLFTNDNLLNNELVCLDATFGKMLDMEVSRK